MKRSDKDDMLFKLAICVNRNITANKLIARASKAEGKKDHKLITSLHQLAAASGIDYATLQRISVGAKNASFTTIAAIADGFSMSLSQFLSDYTTVTPEELEVLRKKKKRSKNAKSN